METPKEQAIKAAYGEHWERVKDYVEDNGWIELYSYNCYTDTVHTDLTEELPFLKELGYERKYYNNGYTHYVRPKSISGIENNNSWTRIESEEDIPDDDKLYDSGLMSVDGNFIQEEKRHAYKTLKWLFQRKLITHYRKVDTVPPPIF